MRVLVLGASSAIGQALAHSFARDSHVYLSGRNHKSLDRLKGELIQDCGALSVTVLVHDLSRGGDIADMDGDTPAADFDVIINAASATSRLRDADILPADIAAHTWADLVGPVTLVERIVERSPHRVHCVLVTSLLSIVRPLALPLPSYKDIYAFFRIQQENFLARLAEDQPERFALTVVRICTPLPIDRITPRHRRIAKRVRGAFLVTREMRFGAIGRSLYYLSLIGPLLVEAILRTRRHSR